MTVPNRGRQWGPPIDVLPLFAREEQALVSVLTGLDAAQWAAPTACPGWSVHDLVAHVLGVKLGRLSRERDGHDGPAPTPDEPFPAFIHRINDDWVRACRRLSPEVLFALVVDSTAQLTDMWKHQDLEELGGPVTWAGPGPAPKWLDVAREYTELWVHQQQIREAAGAPLLDEPELRGPVVDTFMRALPFTLREVTARSGRQIGYTVTGPGGGRWTARASADGWTLERGAPTSRTPLAAVTTDADTFWRLCTGMVKPADVADRVSTVGAESVGETLLRMVTVIA